VRELAERAYFALCLGLGRLLRSAKYSKAWVVHEDGDPSTLREPQGRPEQSRGATISGSSRPLDELRVAPSNVEGRASSRDETQVRKYRFFYAPLLVWLSDPLVRILDAGVRVLPQRDWEERERRVYRSLRGASIRIDADGMLVLPCLAGETLAALLEDPALEESVRKTAIERAVIALAEFHQLGFTHGDAMAENVLIDLEAGAAHWFDFETIHDSSRPMAWRRADDVRALASTCLVRTAPDKLAETLELILDVYEDEGVTRLLATSFTSVLRRPLTFHLAQAGLSFQYFREIARLLRERLGE
jgi:tRNA A-37 threonylcarbamoyl transferase component Bud32